MNAWCKIHRVVVKWPAKEGKGMILKSQWCFWSWLFFCLTLAQSKLDHAIIDKDAVSYKNSIDF